MLPGDRMDETGKEWVGETQASKMTCAFLAQAVSSEDGDKTIANISRALTICQVPFYTLYVYATRLVLTKTW